MNILLLIPSFFIFLYCFYKLIRDDYALMRRNISSEQSFDMIFFVIVFGILFSRLFFFVFHAEKGGNLLLSFLSQSGGLSLVGGVIGGLAGLYLSCKYKKVPLGRFADFLTLAFVTALPLGFLSQIFFAPKDQWILYCVISFIYFLIAVILIKRSYKKLMNRTIGEGRIAALFLIIFPILSILFSLTTSFKNLKTLINVESFTLTGILLFGFFLLIKQKVGGKK